MGNRGGRMGSKADGGDRDDDDDGSPPLRLRPAAMPTQLLPASLGCRGIAGQPVLDVVGCGVV